MKAHLGDLVPISHLIGEDIEGSGWKACAVPLFGQDGREFWARHELSATQTHRESFDKLGSTHRRSARDELVAILSEVLQEGIELAMMLRVDLSACVQTCCECRERSGSFGGADFTNQTIEEKSTATVVDCAPFRLGDTRILNWLRDVLPQEDVERICEVSTCFEQRSVLVDRGLSVGVISWTPIMSANNGISCIGRIWKATTDNGFNFRHWMLDQWNWSVVNQFSSRIAECRKNDLEFLVKLWKIVERTFKFHGDKKSEFTLT